MLKNVIKLFSRALLRVTGDEAEHFLQRLVTKDISCIHIYGAIYAFLLNSRGRICADLIIYKDENNALLLETDANRINFLERTLSTYRLRKKIDIEIVNDLSIYFSEEMSSLQRKRLKVYEDPRIYTFGYRLIEKKDFFTNVSLTENDYLKRRLKWGIAEGFDEIGDQIPLQTNGDIMNGISFEKGCYIGQELIARTHHMGMIRRRVLPINLISSDKKDNLIYGKILVDANNKRQGRILRVSNNGTGIAIVSLDFIGKTLFDELKNTVEVQVPHWWPQNLK